MERIIPSNPKKTDRLRLDQEVRDIEEGLQRARQRDNFVVKPRWATRPQDIRRAMLDEHPNIVHFSGHGEGEVGLVFENEAGETQLVSAEALAGLFELFADTVECVVLNACYSEVQAEAIAKHIPYVIGMNQAIGDLAALEFAVAFYDALGAGRTPEFAHKLACNAIHMAGLPEEHLTPVMLTKSGEAKETQELMIPGKRYAILVGPRYDPEEQGLEVLKYPGSDVDTLRKLLKHQHIGGFHEVAVLKGMLRDRDIFKAVKKIFEQAEQKDLILLYFSGHAGIDAEHGWYFLDSETSLDEFSTAKVSLENLKKHCVMRNKCEHIVMIFDCLYHTEASQPLKNQTLRKAFEALSDVGENRQIDILSTFAQTVEEKEGVVNGFLTHYLADGINSGRADFNHNGSTTLNELYTYVCDAPRFQEHRETYPRPLKWELHVKGDIVLASTSDKPLIKSK